MLDQCGQLQDPIEILTPRKGEDGQGNATAEWDTLAETYAQARDVGGSALYTAAAHQIRNLMDFKIRWRAGMHCGLRIRYRGADYEILQVDHLGNQRRGWMLLHAKLVQGEGDTYGNL